MAFALPLAAAAAVVVGVAVAVDSAVVDWVVAPASVVVAFPVAAFPVVDTAAHRNPVAFAVDIADIQAASAAGIADTGGNLAASAAVAVLERPVDFVVCCLSSCWSDPGFSVLASVWELPT